MQPEAAAAPTAPTVPTLTAPAPAADAAAADAAAADAPTLTVTTYSGGGGGATRELPISHEDAREVVAYARRRADEGGARWVSRPAVPPTVAHDFCGWLEVRAAGGGETLLLRHEWRADCTDTPPGKLLRLLRALPPPGLVAS